MWVPIAVRHVANCNTLFYIYGVFKKSLIIVPNSVCLLIRKNTFMLKCMMPKFNSLRESLFTAFNATLYNTATTVYTCFWLTVTGWQIYAQKHIFHNNGDNHHWVVQEAQLSPSDRAMHLVSSNLANCHVTVQKLLIWQVLTKPMVWSWRFSRRQCVINNVHSTMTRPSRLPLSQVS